jgi:DNA-binding XRE family transcriptional regulator
MSRTVSTKALTGQPANGADSSQVPEILINHDTSFSEEEAISDDDCPIDRRIFCRVFQDVYNRFKISQTDYATACNLSSTTIANLLNQGRFPSWSSCQMLIVGGISFKPTFAQAFWQALPPIIRRGLVENTTSATIRNYAEEYEKASLKSDEVTLEEINHLIGLLDPSRRTNEFFSKIHLSSPNSKNKSSGFSAENPSGGLSSSLHSSGNAHVFHNCHVTVTNLTTFAFPHNIDPMHLDIPAITSAVTNKNNDVPISSVEDN